MLITNIFSTASFSLFGSFSGTKLREFRTELPDFLVKIVRMSDVVSLG
jgi:hypothetical protein